MTHNDKRKLKLQKERFVEAMTQFTQELVPRLGNLAFSLMEVGCDDPERLAVLCAQSGIPFRRESERIEFSLALPSIKFWIGDAKPKGTRAVGKKSGRAGTMRAHAVQH